MQGIRGFLRSLTPTRRVGAAGREDSHIGLCRRRLNQSPLLARVDWIGGSPLAHGRQRSDADARRSRSRHFNHSAPPQVSAAGHYDVATFRP